MADSRTIAILGLNYPPEQTGIAPYTGALATGLVGRGWAVGAQVAHPHYPAWRIARGYGEWTRRETLNGVRLTRRRHYVPGRPRGVRRLLSELSFGARLLLRRRGRSTPSARSRTGTSATIAVSPALFSTWLASWRRGRAPFIVWVQDLYTLGLAETGEGGGLVARITRHIESRTLRRADRVVVIHERFADYVVRELGVAPDRVVVIRNWTHLPLTVPATGSASRDAFGWRAGDTVVLHAGNMGVKQGLEHVVAAAREADRREAPVRFVLLGGGGEHDRLVESARGIERIEFLDPLPDDRFRGALAAADLLLVNEKPGVAAMSVPSKLTSYFDAGRPVIAATDPTGITAAELAASGGGIVVPAGESGSLIDAVLALRADPQRAAALGAAGRRYRETVLDQDAAIDQWEAMLHGLLSQ